MADLFNVPMIDGTVHASDVAVAGIEIARLNATATQKESTTNFSADAQLEEWCERCRQRCAFARWMAVTA